MILQPDDIGGSMTVFNAFPYFEVALRQIDLWPAVLFWDDDNFVFVPVSDEDELEYLFTCVKYEENPIGELRRYALKKQKTQKYLIHLSDLHLGDPKILCGEDRIRTLVRKYLREINQNGSAKVVVTGDAVDSPSKTFENSYNKFSSYIQVCCGESPIRVLGNHDINKHGIALSRHNQKLTNILSEFPKIITLEDERIILLLFNSNTNGSLAQGEIGREQMTKMGNILDEVENLSEYNLIAVLHHHIIPVPTPDVFAKKIFGNIIEKTLVLKDSDAFIEWLKKRDVKVVLHGHKHIPFYGKKDGIDIIACGSSTGQVSMREKWKTYISFNIIKLNRDQIVFSQLVEDINGAGEQSIRSKVIRF